jgi:hypothetical protein
MSKRTVIARARFHIEQGLASLPCYASKEWAEAALLSASSDPAAFWLLLKAGVDPLTPERAERVMFSLRGGKS